jgi:hypothetical protein
MVDAAEVGADIVLVPGFGFQVNTNKELETDTQANV